MADDENPEHRDERSGRDEDELVGYAWVRKRTGLPAGTVYALVHDGQIPHVRLGRRLVRFSRRDIERWLKQHTVSP